MSTLEKKFQEEFIQKCELAQKEYGCRMVRLIQNIEKFGGVKTAKEIMRKGKTSDCFETLVQAGQIKLTMEAMVVEAKYGDLFTDDEVNSCYELLCENGYY